MSQMALQVVSHQEFENNFHIHRALKVLDKRIKTKGISITNSTDLIAYLRLQLESEEREVFGVLFLDNQHRVIEFSRMFLGTINTCRVHSREIVKAALLLNAAAVIFSHNHPSGIAEPSNADRQLTESLSTVLNLIDVRVLDHIVIGHGEAVSFAARGWI
ncbi:RadC family protein [Serratia ficaria]|uniref:RadC family protein n=1 Tax=Serratia ficaria TaxID=61651 RepID=UPI0021830AF3|nr:DNA repair protein RadC [Serratia ficaria]CAI2536161.1 DNA repair protein RadC [Serratia ficaria]